MNNEHEICRIFARIFCDDIGDLPYWYFEMETQPCRCQKHIRKILQSTNNHFLFGNNLGTLIHICSTYWERGGTLFSSFFSPNTFSGNNLCLTIPVVPGSGIECCELKFFSPIHRTHMKLLLIVCFIATLWLLDSFRHVLGACDGLHGIFGEFLSPKKLSCYLFCSLSKVIYFSEILSHFGLFFYSKQ